jgi:hypothetical protein
MGDTPTNGAERPNMAATKGGEGGNMDMTEEDAEPEAQLRVEDLAAAVVANLAVYAYRNSDLDPEVEKATGTLLTLQGLCRRSPEWRESARELLQL